MIVYNLDFCCCWRVLPLQDGHLLQGGGGDQQQDPDRQGGGDQALRHKVNKLQSLLSCEIKCWFQ